MPDQLALERALKWLSEDDATSSRSPRRTCRAEARRAHAEAPSSSRHNRKCRVCRHPERVEIEREFIHWRSPEVIAREYGIAHHSAIYRHAHATGLFAQRATHLKLSLGPLIEKSMAVPVTADSIVRAVALCARLNDDGEWINSPKHVVHHRSQDAPPEPSGGKRNPKLNPNRETGASRT